MHAAREQSFRFRKDLGLPNQVCLFRWAQYSEAVGGAQMERTCGCALAADVARQLRSMLDEGNYGDISKLTVQLETPSCSVPCHGKSAQSCT